MKFVGRIFLLFAAVMPLLAQAQFTFTTNNGAITITGYTGSNGVVFIPDNMDGFPVVSIGDWAFYSTSVTNVVIPDSVTSIGDGAFFDCESLTNVTIGNGVTNIGDWAFAFCPDLTSVSCRGNPPNLEGDNVFYGNAATIYYLPESTGWTPIFDGHPAILWNPPVPFTYTTNSDNVTLTITGYTGSGGAMTIPAAINFLPVTTIGHDAFYYSTNMTSVTIPNSVTTIGNAAFCGCTSLTNAIIGSGVTNIGYWVFQYCSSLTAIMVDAQNLSYGSVDGVLFDRDRTTLVQYPGGKVGSYIMPSSVTSIEYGAFSDCDSLSSVTIPNSVTTIGYAAFYECTRLTNVIIGSGVTSMGDEAFYYCSSLTSIILPNSITNIGDYAFYDCTSLTNVTIGSGITSIGSDAFGFCSGLTRVTLPNSVTLIGNYAFAFCFNLINVTIPNSVTSIGFAAFDDCGSLTSVTIPNSITNIGDYAFYGCVGLTALYFQGNAPSLGLGVFAFNSNLTVYYLPSTTGWDDFSDQTGIPTALWLPQVQMDASLGVQANQFGFNINWASGQTVVVEASTNLSNPDWQPVQTNTLTTGSAYFSDSQWTNYPSRFYRLRSP
jgi:hypothetical protein